MLERGQHDWGLCGPSISVPIISENLGYKMKKSWVNLLFGLTPLHSFDDSKKN